MNQFLIKKCIFFYIKKRNKDYNEVTFIQKSLLNPFEVLIGDFGGYIKKLDMRNPDKFLSQNKKPLSGGIWRVSSKVVKGCEYHAIALCSGDEIVVLNSDCNNILLILVEEVWKDDTTKESWAYGVDWKKTADDDIILKGCSFYDNSSYLYNLSNIFS